MVLWNKEKRTAGGHWALDYIYKVTVISLSCMVLSWSTLYLNYVKSNYRWDFFFCQICIHRLTLKNVMLISACLILSTCDWKLFLVILKKFSISGHTVLPNWECGYISVHFCLWGEALSGRRMLLRMKTMRRRKCCIYAVHGLLSSLTRGNKPCWLSARLCFI